MHRPNPLAGMQNGYVVATSHRLIWIDAAATPQPGRSCYLPLESIHSTNKRVQYGLNLINPKVRLEVKVYVDLKSQPCNGTQAAVLGHCLSCIRQCLHVKDSSRHSLWQ